MNKRTFKTIFRQNTLDGSMDVTYFRSSRRKYGEACDRKKINHIDLV